jgi:hypothetical protein
MKSKDVKDTIHTTVCKYLLNLSQFIISKIKIACRKCAMLSEKMVSLSCYFFTNNKN